MNNTVANTGPARSRCAPSLPCRQHSHDSTRGLASLFHGRCEQLEMVALLNHVVPNRRMLETRLTTLPTVFALVHRNVISSGFEGSPSFQVVTSLESGGHFYDLVSDPHFIALCNARISSHQILLVYESVAVMRSHCCAFMAPAILALHLALWLPM